MTATAIAEAHYARIAAEDGADSRSGGKGINSFPGAEPGAGDGEGCEDRRPGQRWAIRCRCWQVFRWESRTCWRCGAAPATAGSKILAGYMPPYDATAVKKLESAGAVLLGKLNCDEFAMGSSNENSAYRSCEESEGLWIGFRAGRAAGRQRRWRRGLPWRRWERIRAGRSGSRRLSAEWLDCCRHTGG